LTSDTRTPRRTRNWSATDARALLGAAAFFCILCGYYLLRPLRDELGVRGGVDSLDTLFTITFVAMAGAMAAYVWLSARVPRTWIVSGCFAFVCASLLAFRAAYAVVDDALLARALYVWISVINLFLVSGFWSVMSDSFAMGAGLRRFGPVAAGGTAGALVGPAAVAVVAPHVGAADLLFPAAALIAVAAWLLHRVVRAAPADGERRLAATPWSGLARLAGDPRLRGLAGMVILHAMLSTFVYLLQLRLVAGEIDESAQRVQVFAGSDLAVNLLTVALQLGLTSRLLQRSGLAACVSVLPVIALAGTAALSVWPALAVVLVVNVLLRVAQFALTRPARELLFTLLPPVDRYRSRAALDTLVYRASDALGAWVVSALSALGLGTAGIAAAGVPLSALWLALSRRTVRLVVAGAAARPAQEGEMRHEVA
jgi:AAA family ATP:ADP antiporter